MTSHIISAKKTDAIRHGKFNAVIVPDVLYKQLISALPDYLHDQINEAYRFDDAHMKAELRQMLTLTIVADAAAEIEYV